MLKVVQEENESNESAGGSLLDEIVRDGARAMLAAALQAEVAAYVESFADEFDEKGRRLVVRNGHHQPREVTTAAGAIPVRAPRVNDKRIDPVTGKRQRFASAILPAWARKSPRVAEVLPLLYLHGLSSGDFAPALTQFLGTGHGLSPATITRLTKDWQDEAAAFNRRSLAEIDYVYVWVDGIHLKVRLEQDKVCLLVMIGVRADGTKELIALDDGHRESTESWADLLRSAKRRGMRAPVLAVGDGALGFWAAVRQVFPETREQRCWFHKIANVLNCLPKSAQPGAKAALAEIWNAEDKEHAEAGARAFAAEYGAKWPKAAAKITDDLDVLLEFYDYPAEHWVHLRTTNPIESTFATVRLRQRVTKGPGSRAAGIAMAFKLIESAQARWRAVNAPHLVALVRAGATFNKGVLVERDDDQP
ncbi:IS256 family transposase, partial [Nocardioides pakistanensis]